MDRQARKLQAQREETSEKKTSTPTPTSVSSTTEDSKDKVDKGQLISECLFQFFSIFQKNNEKLDKFLSQNLKSGQIIE